MTKNIDKEVQVTLTYQEASAIAYLLWHNVSCHVGAGRLRDKLLDSLPGALALRLNAIGGVVRPMHDVQLGVSNDCGVVLSGSDLFEIGEILVNEALPDWEEWDASMLETLDRDAVISVRTSTGVEYHDVLAGDYLVWLAWWCKNPLNNITHIKRK